MSVIVLVRVVGGDGGTPFSSTLERFVLGIDTGVDDKDGDALTSLGVVLVLVESAEGQALAVGDTSKTPGGTVLDGDL